MAYTLTTQLEAVNAILAALGEAPVTSIVTPSSLPLVAQISLTVLDETCKEVQTEGWDFNSEYDVELVPAGGVITVPTDAIQIDPVDASVNYVQRGDTLFDKDTNSSTSFDKTIKFNLIRLLDWDKTPETFRRYVTIRAGRITQGKVLGSRELEAQMLRDEGQARARLEESDYQGSDRTIFQSYDVNVRRGINRAFRV